MKDRVLIAISGHAGVGKDTAADYLVANKLFVKVALADPLKRICKEVYGFTDEQLWGPSEMRNAPDRRYVRQKVGAIGGSYIGKGDLSGTVFEKYAHLRDENGVIPSPAETVYLTARYALQTLGTEWGRNCYHNTWIDYGIKTARALIDGEGSYSAKKGFVPYMSGVDEPQQIGGVVFSDIRFKNEFDLVKYAGGFLIRIHRRKRGELTGGVAGHASEEEQNDVEDDFFDAVIYNDGPKEDLYRQLDRAIEAAKERQ